MSSFPTIPAPPREIPLTTFTMVPPRDRVWPQVIPVQLHGYIPSSLQVPSWILEEYLMDDFQWRSAVAWDLSEVPRPVAPSACLVNRRSSSRTNKRTRRCSRRGTVVFAMIDVISLRTSYEVTMTALVEQNARGRSVSRCRCQSSSCSV